MDTEGCADSEAAHASQREAVTALDVLVGGRRVAIAQPAASLTKLALAVDSRTSTASPADARLSAASSARLSAQQRTSKEESAAEMRNFLLGAQLQGRALQLRAHLPPCVAALVCTAVCFSVWLTLARTPWVEALVTHLLTASVFFVVFAAQGAGRRAAFAALLIVLVDLLAACARVAYGTIVTGLNGPFSCRLAREGCCDLAQYGQSAALLFGEDVPCWFLHFHLLWRLALRFVVMGAMAARIGALLSRSGLLASERLDAMWLTLGHASGAMAVADGFHALAMAALRLVGPNRLEFGLVVLRVVNFALVAIVALRAKLRARAHGWLASRGEVISTAVGISALIGSRGVDELHAKALATLRSIRLDLLTERDFDSNANDADLFRRSERAVFGEVDAFVSHSWRDDAADKWRLLQSWRVDFKRRSGGREPTIWLDKACIEPGDVDTQLALLPVYTASCRSFIVIFTTTYLTRLWCVVELFVWMHVRDTTSIVVLCGRDWLETRASSASNSPSSTAADDVGTPRTPTASPASQLARGSRGSSSVMPVSSSTSAPALLVLPPSHPAACDGSADELARMRDAQLCISSATQRVQAFSVHDSTCWGARTAHRLRSVIEIGCGGLDAFDGISRIVLTERLDAHAALLAQRMQQRARRISSPQRVGRQRAVTWVAMRAGAPRTTARAGQALSDIEHEGSTGTISCSQSMSSLDSRGASGLDSREASSLPSDLPRRTRASSSTSSVGEPSGAQLDVVDVAATDGICVCDARSMLLASASSRSLQLPGLSRSAVLKSPVAIRRQASLSHHRPAASISPL